MTNKLVKGNHIAKASVFLGLGFFAYYKVKQYEKFISNLKFGLTVLKIDSENSKSSILVENLSHSNIPSAYNIESIELISDTKKLAINTNNVAGLVVQNADTPIPFQLQNTTTINEIEASNIVVTYNFLGFLKRKIKYESKEVVNIETVENAKTEAKEIGNDCCCH